MRIRTVKPEFWRSDDITALPREYRLLFIGLWSYVDDNGVGIADPRRIAADLFALEEDQKEVREYVTEGLRRLYGASLVTLYVIDTVQYLYINTWRKHQRVANANRPRYPEPSDEPDPPTSGYVVPTEDLRRDSEGIRPVTEEQRNRGTEDKDTDSCVADATSTASRRRPAGDLDGFEAFWEVCPRKISKESARKAYRKARARGASPDLLRQKMIIQRAFWRRTSTEDRFIPHPATWLNGGRWEDPDPPAVASGVAVGHPDRSAENGGLGPGTAARKAAAILAMKTGNGEQRAEG